MSFFSLDGHLTRSLVLIGLPVPRFRLCHPHVHRPPPPGFWPCHPHVHRPLPPSISIAPGPNWSKVLVHLLASSPSHLSRRTTSASPHCTAAASCRQWAAADKRTPQAPPSSRVATDQWCPKELPQSTKPPGLSSAMSPSPMTAASDRPLVKPTPPWAPPVYHAALWPINRCQHLPYCSTVTISLPPNNGAMEYPSPMSLSLPRPPCQTGSLPCRPTLGLLPDPPAALAHRKTPPPSRHSKPLPCFWFGPTRCGPNEQCHLWILQWFV
jgi:hypothetical protein